MKKNKNKELSVQNEFEESSSEEECFREPQLAKAPTVLLNADEELAGMNTRFMSENEISLLQERPSTYMAGNQKSESKNGSIQKTPKSPQDEQDK